MGVTGTVKDKGEWRDRVPKVPKENRETIDHNVIRKRFKPWTRRRGARARALRQTMTTMSCDEMTNVTHPYWQDGKSIASFERAHNPTSETGILWWAERIGIHPGMLLINRPNCIKGWDGLLNQALHVFEQTPDGSRECDVMVNDLQAAVENAMEYFQKREEQRAEAAAQEIKVVTIPAHLIDGMKEALDRNEEDRKLHSAEIERLKEELRRHGIDL
jgi:hypothetical protein